MALDIMLLPRASRAKFKEILHMLLPKFWIKFSGGYLLLGKQIRISDFAQQVNLNSRENDDYEVRSMFV